MTSEAPFIYLDHMASTPLDPAVRDAMLPWFGAAQAGNPHSEHPAGWRAAKAIDAARAEVAQLIGAQPSEILFTSGATEANNLALFGVAGRIDRIVVSAIEHPSVHEPAEALCARGIAVEVLPVDAQGLVDLAALERALKGGAALVSIMAANNEIGTMQPLAGIAALCRARGAIFHSDAAQLLSTQALDVGQAGVDLVSLSGHKLYGPQGIGALYVRAGLELTPLVHGGGQQKGLRAGTVPVALAVGLGAACRLARERRAEDAVRLRELRERLFDRLRSEEPDIRRNSPLDGLPGCLNVTLPGIDAADLLLDLPDLAISTGSACSALAAKPSHVLRAIGLSPEAAHASLRFGLGRDTTAAQLDAAVDRLIAALRTRDRRAAP